jgi:integrase/recombinase XerD
MDAMATKFKKNTTWYIRHKNDQGKWVNICCGSNATAGDAEAIRKNYDSKELNQLHGLQVKQIDTDLRTQLIAYRDHEIPRSRTGRPKSAKSIQRYKALIDNFITFIDSKNLTTYRSITEEQSKRFFDTLFEAKRSASTISKHREVLINFFKWSMANHYHDRNPMLCIGSPKREKKPPRFFSETELEKIFTGSKEPYTDIFKFAYLTGMRIGEIGNAEINHFIPHLHALRIPVMEGNKTKREETLPLNTEAEEIIIRQEKYRAQFNTEDSNKYIFINAIGLKLDNGNIYSNFMRTLKNEKIFGASPHTLRHTTASHLVIKNVSLYIVKDILRHASIRESEIYAHLSKEPVRKAIGLLTTRI